MFVTGDVWVSKVKIEKYEALEVNLLLLSSKSLQNITRTIPALLGHSVEVAKFSCQVNMNRKMTFADKNR